MCKNECVRSDLNPKISLVAWQDMFLTRHFFVLFFLVDWIRKISRRSRNRNGAYLEEVRGRPYSNGQEKPYSA